jgi:hypothetical protein
MNKYAAEKIASDFYEVGIQLALDNAGLTKTARPSGKQLAQALGLATGGGVAAGAGAKALGYKLPGGLEAALAKVMGRGAPVPTPPGAMGRNIHKVIEDYGAGTGALKNLEPAGSGIENIVSHNYLTKYLDKFDPKSLGNFPAHYNGAGTGALKNLEPAGSGIENIVANNYLTKYLDKFDPKSLGNFPAHYNAPSKGIPTLLDSAAQRSNPMAALEQFVPGVNVPAALSGVTAAKPNLSALEQFIPGINASRSLEGLNVNELIRMATQQY